MTNPAKLPAQFAALESLVAEWALTYERDRFNKLIGSSIVDMKRFYDAIAPRAEEMTLYPGRYRPEEMPEEARTLFFLLATFIETACPVELDWQITDIDGPYPMDRTEFGEASRLPPI